MCAAEVSRMDLYGKILREPSTQISRKLQLFTSHPSNALSKLLCTLDNFKKPSTLDKLSPKKSVKWLKIEYFDIEKNKHQTVYIDPACVPASYEIKVPQEIGAVDPSTVFHQYVPCKEKRLRAKVTLSKVTLSTIKEQNSFHHLIAKQHKELLDIPLNFGGRKLELLIDPREESNGLGTLAKFDKLDQGTFKKFHDGFDIQSNRYVGIAITDLTPTKHEKPLKAAIDEHRNYQLLVNAGISNGIVRYYRIVYCYINNRPCQVIVMKCCREGCLFNKIAPKRLLTIDDIFNITERLCEILSSLHAKNLIHRDIKLENVFLDSKKNPYLGDYAFLTSLPCNSEDFCGSPAYISSEIVETVIHNLPVITAYEHYKAACIRNGLKFAPRKPLKPYPFTVKSDVSAMGVLLYGLWYRDMPQFSKILNKDHFSEALEKWKSTPEPPNPQSFKHLLYRMMHYNPELRPTMHEVVECIKNNKDNFKNELSQVLYGKN